jgi:hypothetical protein
MPFRMQPAQFPLGGFPEGEELPLSATSQTFAPGTPVTFDTGADNGIEEAPGGATVTNIKGIAQDGVVANVSNNPSGKINVVYAGRGNVFMAKLINGSGVVQTPDLDNVHAVYGILKQGTGVNQWWGVDESDTTDVVVEVLGFDLNIGGTGGVVFFKFIESAIQAP